MPVHGPPHRTEALASWFLSRFLDAHSHQHLSWGVRRSRTMVPAAPRAPACRQQTPAPVAHRWAHQPPTGHRSLARRQPCQHSRWWACSALARVWGPCLLLHALLASGSAYAHATVVLHNPSKTTGCGCAGWGAAAAQGRTRGWRRICSRAAGRSLRRGLASQRSRAAGSTAARTPAMQVCICRCVLCRAKQTVHNLTLRGIFVAKHHTWSLCRSYLQEKQQ